MSLQKTDLNVAPFFDDYDETKSFHRILFRPRSVQARELTQAQTILQGQIDRLGRHLFEEGSVVIPGGVHHKIDQDVVTVSFTGTITADELNGNIGKIYLKSKTTSMEAMILKYKAPLGAIPPSLAIEYSRAVGATTKFADGEPCSIVLRDSAGVETEIANASIVTSHKGIMAYVRSGVYFVRGHLVATKDQAILASIDNTANIRVGFQVKEYIIDETKDASLFSNAVGTPNFKSPGASRLKIDLVLTSSAQTDSDPDLIELLRFTAGQLEKKVDQTQYAQLEKTLAQRTYEESGDYSVKDFPITPYNHLLSATNKDGLFTAAQGGDDNKLVFRLGQGVAYVKGSRSEISGFYDVVVDKTRDTEIINNGIMGADFGSYFVVQNAASIPFVDIKNRINFLAADGVTVVGSFLVRSIKRESSTKIRFYVMDMTFTASYTLADAKKIKYSDGSNLVTADIVASVIFSGTNDSMLFRLPYNSVKSMKGVGGVSDTSYSVVRNYDVTLNSSGVGSISLPTGELFSSINDYDYLVALTGSATPGTFFSVSTLSLSGSPVGKVLNVNLGAPGSNKVARVICKVVKQNPMPKSKTLRTATETLTFAGETKKTLANSDIYRIVSVTNLQNSAIETSSFTFWDGQRQNWYERGQIISPTALTGQWSVQYEWFEHSVGDYFNVDSYGGMAREAIPMTRETADRIPVSLADCIDFRPRRDTSGAFTLSSFAGDIVDPSDNIRFDLTHYLPRIDLIYATSDGSFQAIKGVPSEAPSAPSVPANGMPLYEAFIPAYVLAGSEVSFKSFDNRRYTMRDIGKLDKRLSNVEYYTALSLLEAKADRLNVVDSTTGTTRFKNGFAVDGFKDPAMADIYDLDWRAAVDVAKGRLKADFVVNGASLYQSSSIDTAGVELVSKGYTHTKFVSQPYMTGTMNINPYLVVTWTGTIKLTPNSDFWKDVEYISPTIVKVNTTFVDQTIGVDTPTGNFWSKVDLQTTSTEVTDKVISFVPINKMRAKDVTFTLTGFKPYARLYPFFNSSPVSVYCKPTGGNYNDPIVCDSKGAASGIFSIPNNDTKSFPTGSIVFRMTDSPTDDREGLTTEGEAVFTSQGSLESRQKTSTTNISIRRVWQQRRNVDPIAQTFRVTEAGGCFLSKVDVFFNKKSRTLPVTLQLRPVKDGLPTNEVLPFGEVKLNFDQVSADATGVTPTTFVFSDPIYLEEGLEYAIVLISDSQDYEVFISTMGQKMLDRNEMVAKQPHLGVLLSSSNASTWTPHQLDDLKFNLYKATFATTDSTATFKTSNNVARRLPFNSLVSTTASTTVRVYLKSHGLKTGDTATLSGVVGGNGIVSAEVNTTKTVVAYDMDWFEFTVTTAATMSGNFGGNDGKALVNYPFTEVESFINQMTVSGTSIDWQIRYMSQVSRIWTSWVPLTINTYQKMIDEGMGNLDTVEVQATLKTNNPNLTPQIDLTALGLGLLERRIDTNSTTPAYSYVTKSLKFDNPSTQSKIFIASTLPNGNTLKVHYKLLTTGDESTVNKPWVEVLPVKPLQNGNLTQEYEYIISGVGTFSGYKLRVSFLGTDQAQTPEVESITTIALA